MIPGALAYYFIVVVFGHPFQSGPYLTPGACEHVRHLSRETGDNSTVCYLAPVKIEGDWVRA